MGDRRSLTLLVALSRDPGRAGLGALVLPTQGMHAYGLMSVLISRPSYRSESSVPNGPSSRSIEPIPRPLESFRRVVSLGSRSPPSWKTGGKPGHVGVEHGVAVGAQLGQRRIKIDRVP